MRITSHDPAICICCECHWRTKVWSALISTDWLLFQEIVVIPSFSQRRPILLSFMFNALLALDSVWELEFNSSLGSQSRWAVWLPGSLSQGTQCSCESTSPLWNWTNWNSSLQDRPYGRLDPVLKINPVDPFLYFGNSIKPWVVAVPLTSPIFTPIWSWIMVAEHIGQCIFYRIILEFGSGIYKNAEWISTWYYSVIYHRCLRSIYAAPINQAQWYRCYYRHPLQSSCMVISMLQYPVYVFCINTKSSVLTSIHRIVIAIASIPIWSDPGTGTEVE